MSRKKENAAIVGVGVAACAVCCAGPILGVLAAIGLGTAAGFALFGTVAIVVGAAAAAFVMVRRRRRAGSVRTDRGVRSRASRFPDVEPTIQTHRHGGGSGQSSTSLVIMSATSVVAPGSHVRNKVEVEHALIVEMHRTRNRCRTARRRTLRLSQNGTASPMSATGSVGVSVERHQQRLLSHPTQMRHNLIWSSDTFCRIGMSSGWSPIRSRSRARAARRRDGTRVHASSRIALCAS